MRSEHSVKTPPALEHILLVVSQQWSPLHVLATHMTGFSEGHVFA